MLKVWPRQIIVRKIKWDVFLTTELNSTIYQRKVPKKIDDQDKNDRDHVTGIIVSIDDFDVYSTRTSKKGPIYHRDNHLDIWHRSCERLSFCHCTTALATLIRALLPGTAGICFQLNISFPVEFWEQNFEFWGLALRYRRLPSCVILFLFFFSFSPVQSYCTRKILWRKEKVEYEVERRSYSLQTPERKSRLWLTVINQIWSLHSISM